MPEYITVVHCTIIFIYRQCTVVHLYAKCIIRVRRHCRNGTEWDFYLSWTLAECVFFYENLDFIKNKNKLNLREKFMKIIISKFTVIFFSYTNGNYFSFYYDRLAIDDFFLIT